MNKISLQDLCEKIDSMYEDMLDNFNIILEKLGAEKPTTKEYIAAEIPNTEYVTIKEDDVYVGGKPATEYNSEKIYNRYFCPAYFKEARDIIREEYGYELLEIHCLQSSTDGEYAKSGNPIPDASGNFCWVRVKFKDKNGTPAASLWVFRNTRGSASDCAAYCAYNCGYHVQHNSGVRSGLFGSVRNDIKDD